MDPSSRNISQVDDCIQWIVRCCILVEELFFFEMSKQWRNLIEEYHIVNKNIWDEVDNWKQNMSVRFDFWGAKGEGGEQVRKNYLASLVD